MPMREGSSGGGNEGRRERDTRTGQDGAQAPQTQTSRWGVASPQRISARHGTAQQPSTQQTTTVRPHRTTPLIASRHTLPLHPIPAPSQHHPSTIPSHHQTSPHHTSPHSHSSNTLHSLPPLTTLTPLTPTHSSLSRSPHSTLLHSLSLPLSLSSRVLRFPVPYLLPRTSVRHASVFRFAVVCSDGMSAGCRRVRAYHSYRLHVWPVV